MPRYYNNLDVNGNQIQNAVIQPLASDPGTPATAQIWFHNTAGSDSQGRLKVKLGTRTMIIDDQYVSGVTVSGVLLNGGTALAPQLSVQAADSTHDGYLSSALWSRLNTATSVATASTLAMRDASGNAAFNMLTISGTPVNGTDGVNKNYADSIAAGFDPKGSVVLATTLALPTCTYANGSSGVGATTWRASPRQGRFRLTRSRSSMVRSPHRMRPRVCMILARTGSSSFTPGPPASLST